VRILGVRFFFTGFGERRRAVGKRRGPASRKSDDGQQLGGSPLAAGAAGVAEGGRRRRWEARGTVVVGQGGWVFVR
jgi:hypothetical protein